MLSFGDISSLYKIYLGLGLFVVVVASSCSGGGLGFGFWVILYFIVEIYYFNVLYDKIKVGMLGVL